MIQHKQVMASVAMAGRVKRYHTFPMICEQTVAAHSWRVAMIYIKLFGRPRAEVLEYILCHDLGELAAGDAPFYSKRRIPALKEASNEAESFGLVDLGLELPTLTEGEWKQFKIADLLEMYEHGNIERTMGNQYGYVVCSNIMEALRGMVSNHEIANYFTSLWDGEIT